MAFRTSEEYRRTWNELQRRGLLMATDQVFPSVTTLVAGEPVRGSWWGHSRSQDIFQVMEQLAEHPDVLTVKLISGKITFVHRALWPAVLAIGRGHEPWQLAGLPTAAMSLLRRVKNQGRVDAEEALRSRSGSARPARAAIDALENKLLVHVEQIHTKTGAHARSLESWEHWAKRVSFSGPDMTPKLGMERILSTVRELCRESGGSCRLPWE